MIRKKLLITIGMLVLVAAVTAAYRRPYVWWPVNDMSEQPILKPFHVDGLRDPEPGTLSTDAWDPVPPKLEVAANQHPDFTNPVAATPESVAKGKEFFGIYCIQCHGDAMKTEVQTPVMLKGMPGAKMPRVSMLSDAEIFSTITYGNAIMKRMDYHLSPEERWHVVNYLRTEIEKYKAGQQ